MASVLMAADGWQDKEDGWRAKANLATTPLLPCRHPIMDHSYSVQVITMMLAVELYGVISLIFTALYLSWGWLRANKVWQ